MTLNKGLLLKVAGGTVATGGAGTTIFFAIHDKQQTQTANPVEGGGAVDGVSEGENGKSTDTGDVGNAGGGHENGIEEGREQQPSISQGSTGSEGVSEVPRQVQDATQGQDHVSVQTDSQREHDSGSDPAQKTTTEERERTTDNARNDQIENTENLSSSQQSQKGGSQIPEASENENHSNKDSLGADSKNNSSQESSITSGESSASGGQPQDQGSPSPSLPTAGEDRSENSPGTSDSGDQQTVVQPTHELTAVEKINQKLKDVGIPDDCKFTDENNRKIECSLSKEEKLENINFQDDDNGNSEDIDGDISEFKVKIWWLKKDQITSYGSKDQDLVFTFHGFKEGDIKIGSGEDLKFIKDTNPDFIITGNEGDKKLKNLWEGPYELAPKVNLKVKNGNNYCFEENKSFKFSNDGGANIQDLTPTNPSSVQIVAEDEEEGFNQSFKYTLNQEIEGSDGLKLETGDYEIKYDETKGWYFSKKTLTKPTIVTEHSPASTVVSTTTTTPSSGTVLDSTKISELNNKLDLLQLPEECKFAKGQTGNSKECSISRDDLNKINFSDKTQGGEITSTKAEGVKLKVEYVSETKKVDYGLEDNLLFTFSGFEDDIEIDDGLNLYKGTSPEFKIEDDELKKLWDDEEVTGFGKKVGLEGSSGFCALKVGSTLRFSENNGETIQQLTPTSDITGKIVCTTRTEDFNQGYKFVFNSDLTIGTETLTRGNYEIKYHVSNGWYLSKKSNN